MFLLPVDFSRASNSQAWVRASQCRSPHRWQKASYSSIVPKVCSGRKLESAVRASHLTRLNSGAGEYLNHQVKHQLLIYFKKKHFVFSSLISIHFLNNIHSTLPTSPISYSIIIIQFFMLKNTPPLPYYSLFGLVISHVWYLGSSQSVC